MARTFTIPVFQEKDEGQVTWTTVGLGDHVFRESGRSAVKVQQRLVDRLRRHLTETDPADLELFVLRPGTTLRRLRVDVKLADGSRTAIAGVFPFVVEARWLGGDDEVLVAYHPLRQHQWFAARTEADLEAAANAHCKRAWTQYDDPDELACKKGSLRTLSFAAQPMTLLDKLPGKEERRRGRVSAAGNVLARIGTDQTLRAIDGTLALGMPRTSYRRRLQLHLGGADMRPVIVVGPPGVGKSTIIHRWIADRLVEDEFEIHRNLDRIHHVWEISGKRLIAGMSYLGDWEQRCIELLAECKKKRAILWIEDLHLFGRLGRSRESDRNLAEMLRGPLARGEVTIVGELTVEQLQRLEDDAPAFASLFTRVHVTPTTPAETMQMMVHSARSLEQQGGCRFDPFTYRTVLEVGGALFPARAFPGKALDLLRKLTDVYDGAPGRVVPSSVIELLSRETGLPRSLLTLDVRLDPAEVEEAFARRVMGQPDATAAACDLVHRIRAGLTDPSRPFAVYLFTGPTGTGKTELAKSLAEYLYGDPARLVRLDMSEYATPDAPARLIGDRWEPEGRLVRRLRHQPFCVLLLDEIEKAHRSVLHLLLQLFDEGRLTDAAGNTASFRHAVVAMTSNLGARPQAPIGFGDETAGMMADIARAVREFFPPELFNRIDKVVPFRPLDAEVAEDIVTKELSLLLGRRGLAERNVFVYASDAVKRRAVAEAFDPRLGARTVKRYLEDRVGSLLADEVTRKVASMQVMRLYDADGELRVHVDPLVEAEPAEAQYALEPLIGLPALRLQEHLAAAGDELRALASSPRLDEVTERVRASARRDELFYFLDAYRERVRELAVWIEPRVDRLRAGPDPELLEAEAFARDTIKTPRPARDATVQSVRRFDLRAMKPRAEAAGKDEMLAAIAEVSFLHRLLERIAEPEAHAVWVELLRVERGRDGGGRRAAAREGRGLFEWLASAYAALGGDAFEGGALLLSNGETVDVVPGGSDGAVDFRIALNQRAEHCAIRLVGLGVRDKLVGEEGCHVWTSHIGEPEIVRVSLHGGDIDAAPSSRIARHAAARAAFERALDAGGELPPDPSRLLPIVRTFDFRPPMRPGEVVRMEVEDFHLGYADALWAATVADALRALWHLRWSRVQPVTGHAEEQVS